MTMSASTAPAFSSDVENHQEQQRQSDATSVRELGVEASKRRSFQDRRDTAQAERGEIFENTVSSLSGFSLPLRRLKL